MAAGGSTRTVVTAALANAGIAVAKFVAFLFTGASSMLAEAIHSVADTSNQLLLLLGGRRARRDFSDLHQFGYGRERYFWSFVVAIVLFLLGGVFALFEGVEKLRHPHEIEAPMWAVSVLVIAIGLEAYAFRTAIIESRKIKGDRSWWGFIRHSRTPELPVVLLEDAGAQTGLVLALVGVGLTTLTGDPRWDALGTISIGVLLTAIAILLAVEMRSLLIGESARGPDDTALREAIRTDPDIAELLHLRTQHTGPEELLVTGKVRMREGMTFRDVAAAIDRVETAMRERVPIARMIYLEPGTRLAPHEIPGSDRHG